MVIAGRVAGRALPGLRVEYAQATGGEIDAPSSGRCPSQGRESTLPLSSLSRHLVVALFWKVTTEAAEAGNGTAGYEHGDAENRHCGELMAADGERRYLVIAS
jgi:hypothetical protein